MKFVVSSFFLFFSVVRFMCECFNLIYAKNFGCCCFELFNYFYYACFCLLCVCVVYCFVLIHSIITRIKSKATEIEHYVECFVLISLSIYSSVFFFVCIVDLLRFSTRNRIGIPSFNRVFLFCVLAIKTVTLFLITIFLEKNIIDISSLLHISFVCGSLIIKSNNK